MKGLAMRRRAVWIVAGAMLLLVAGGATALFLTSRRDVTTTSSAAYDAYREGVANENRFYFKEARVAFARALELDPNFAMAMLGLSRQATDESQRLALVKRAAREEPRLTEREKLSIEMQLAFASRSYADGIAIARELHAKFPNDVRSAQTLAHEEIRRGKTDNAIRIFEEKFAEIDMLLSDVRMPGMTGPELNARLRELKPELPVLFMTGYAGPTPIPINILEKPFRMDELFERIAQTLCKETVESVGRSG